MTHLRPVHSKADYDRMVALMDSVLDVVGDDEEHPLSGQPSCPRATFPRSLQASARSAPRWRASWASSSTLVPLCSSLVEIVAAPMRRSKPPHPAVTDLRLAAFKTTSNPSAEFLRLLGLLADKVYFLVGGESG